MQLPRKRCNCYRAIRNLIELQPLGVFRLPLYIDGDDTIKFSTCWTRCLGILVLIAFAGYVAYQRYLFGGLESFNIQTVPYVRLNETMKSYSKLEPFPSKQSQMLMQLIVDGDKGNLNKEDL